MINQAFKKALESRSELARELNDFNTVIQKKDADRLTLFSYFKRTSPNFDLGGEEEPDRAIFTVARSELDAWQRCVDLMTSMCCACLSLRIAATRSKRHCDSAPPFGVAAAVQICATALRVSITAPSPRAGWRLRCSIVSIPRWPGYSD